MALAFTPPPSRATLNVLLYAAPGLGKSTGASTAPGPLLYVNAEGPNALMYPRRRFGNAKFHEVTVDATNAKEQLDEVVLHVKSGRGDEQTVVVDSIGEVYGRLIEQLSGGEKPTLPQYGDATSRLLRFCRALRDAPINVVFLAHELSFRNTETGMVERVPFCGTSNEQTALKLMAAVDVLAAGVVKRGDDGEARYGAMLSPVDGRHAKDRTASLGAARLVDIAEWVQIAKDAPRAEDAPAGAEPEASE